MRRKILIIVFTILVFSSLYSENQNNLIYLIDTSGSMVGKLGTGGKNIFPKVKETILEMIDDIDIAESPTVVIMTFDEGVQSEWELVLDKEEDKQLIKDYIMPLRADGLNTWITHGLDDALRKTVILKEKYGTDVQQYLFMFTDALNTGPGIPPISFDYIEKEYNLEHDKNLNCYIITLGLPKDTGWVQTVPSSISVRAEPPGQSSIPIDIDLKADKTDYVTGESVLLSGKSKAIKLKQQSIQVQIIYPNGSTKIIELSHIEDYLFKGEFDDTRIPGKYLFQVVTQQSNNYILYSNKELELTIRPKKFLINWTSVKRMSRSDTQRVSLSISSKNLENPLEVYCHLASEDPTKLLISKDGKIFSDFILVLKPGDATKVSFVLYSPKKINCFTGIRINGKIMEHYTFHKRIYGTIPFYVWVALIVIILVIAILIGLFVITPYRFRNKLIIQNDAQYDIRDYRSFYKSTISFDSDYDLNAPNSYIGIEWFGYGVWILKESNNTTRGWENIIGTTRIINNESIGFRNF